MSEVEERLAEIHKTLLYSINPFTGMLSRRKLSPAELRRVINNVRYSCDQLEKFLNGYHL